MFLNYYGLREQPFGVTPDLRYLYFGPAHREALASLYYGLETGRAFLALIAKPGMGKTTLLLQLLEQLRGSSHTVFLFQTQCSSRELLRYVLVDLGIKEPAQDLVSMHEQLKEALLGAWQSGKRLVLIIDEAQGLEDAALELVRLLSNFETTHSKLMQIVLAGQPALAARLGHCTLDPLRQRLSIISRLSPFGPAETSHYIEHRLQVAGYVGKPLFTRDAVALLSAHTHGIPRMINNFCFNALSLGYAQRKRTIDTSIVQRVAADLDIDGLLSEMQQPAPPALLAEASHSLSLTAPSAASLDVSARSLPAGSSLSHAQRLARPQKIRTLRLSGLRLLALGLLTFSASLFTSALVDRLSIPTLVSGEVVLEGRPAAGDRQSRRVQSTTLLRRARAGASRGVQRFGRQIKQLVGTDGALPASAPLSADDPSTPKAGESAGPGKS